MKALICWLLSKLYPLSLDEWVEWEDEVIPGVDLITIRQENGK